MIKRIKMLLPAVLAVLLLAGCNVQSAAATTARYRVTVVAKSRESEFWKAVLSGAEAAATEYNMQLTVLAPDNEENYDAQNQLIEKAVEDGAQAIVFSAIDYEANAEAIDAAAAAGVTIVGIDSAVHSDQVAAYIGVRQLRRRASWRPSSALEGTEGKLCVGLINYEVNGANGRDREQGARDTFADSGRAEVVTVDADPSECSQCAQRCLADAAAAPRDQCAGGLQRGHRRGGRAGCAGDGAGR